MVEVKSRSKEHANLAKFALSLSALTHPAGYDGGANIERGDRALLANDERIMLQCLCTNLIGLLALSSAWRCSKFDVPTTSLSPTPRLTARGWGCANDPAPGTWVM